MQKNLGNQKRVAKAKETVSEGGMRKFTLPGSVRSAGWFFSRLNVPLGVFVAMLLGAGTAAQGAGPDPLPGVAAVVSGSGIVISQPSSNVVRTTFNGQAPNSSNITLDAAEFVNLSQLVNGTLFSGRLVSVTASFSLVNYDANLRPDLWVTDLTVYIAASSASNPSLTGSTLQVGGTNVFNSSVGGVALDWGGSLLDPNVDSLSQLVSISTDVSSLNIILAPANNPEVWLANGLTGMGYDPGVWSGYIDFTFASSGGSGVPDASRTALLLAPGTLFLLGLAGRSRRRG